MAVGDKYKKTIPQSASLTAFGPGRKHSLLPALATNSPLGCLLNASRPLHKGAKEEFYITNKKFTYKGEISKMMQNRTHNCNELRL